MTMRPSWRSTPNAQQRPIRCLKTKLCVVCLGHGAKLDDDVRFTRSVHGNLTKVMSICKDTTFRRDGTGACQGAWILSGEHRGIERSCVGSLRPERLERGHAKVESLGTKE
jgi:hypothetical protein